MMYGYTVLRNDHQIYLLHDNVRRMTEHEYVPLKERTEAMQVLIEGFAHSFFGATETNENERISVVCTYGEEEESELSRKVRDGFNYKGSMCYAEVKLQVTEEFGVFTLVQITDYYPHTTISEPKIYYIYFVRFSKLQEFVRFYKRATSIKLSEIYWTHPARSSDVGLLTSIISDDTSLFHIGADNDA